MNDSEKEDLGWCIIEIMGHRRLAGYVREAALAGVGFLKIDIPCDPPATQFYPPASIFCVTPVTEEVARSLASTCQPAPVSRWELPAPDLNRDEETPDEDNNISF